MQIDETHDPALASWVESANAEDCDFPIQNLPFGVFRRRGDDGRGHVGVAIGDRILEVGQVVDLLPAQARAAAEACKGPCLNGLMALGRPASGALRKGLSQLLSDTRRQTAVEHALTAMTEAEMLLPVRIGDYTDFFASVHHASNVGKLLRPDNPLLPNYKWVPIAYHGRASSVVASGTPVRRPIGQGAPRGSDAPEVRPSRNLDYEMELGVYIGAPCPAGAPTPVGEAGEHVFGVCLLNDWSARDVQAWEYQPLGPFLAKNFATTVSPWVVTAEALAPFRAPVAPRPEGDPKPLPYLYSPQDQAQGGYEIEMEAFVSSQKMRAEGAAPVRVSHAVFSDAMYWTIAQLIAHHTSGGCDLRTGDLLGSGTVTGPERATAGCLLEITARGGEPISLPGGESRTFLEDGDEVVMTGRCRRQGFRSIGLGECRGVVQPA